MTEAADDQPAQRKALAPRLEYGEVRPILEQLVAAGKARPSALDLFAKVQRGSTTTLQKFVDRFREEQQKEKESQQFKFSAEDEEFFDKAASQYRTQLRTRFVAIAHSRIESEQQALQADLEELRQAKAMFMAECERMESAIKEERDLHGTEVLRLNGRIAVLEPLESQLKDVLKDLGEVREAKASADTRIDLLEKDLKLAKAELEESRRRQGLVEQEKAAAETRAKAAESQLQISNEALRSAQDEIIRLKVQLEAIPALDAKIKDLERDSKLAKDELEESRRRQSLIEQARTAAETQLKTMSETLRTSQDESIRLRVKLEILPGLETQLKQLTDDVKSERDARYAAERQKVAAETALSLLKPMHEKFVPETIQAFPVSESSPSNGGKVESEEDRPKPKK